MLRLPLKSPVSLKTGLLVALLAGALVVAGVVLFGLLRGPAPATLTIAGPIQDAVTGHPVPAAVYVDGRLVRSGVITLDITVPLHRDRRTEIRVTAAGYTDWAIAVTGGTVRRLDGPVRLHPLPPPSGVGG
jgi:hypothetical protein